MMQSKLLSLLFVTLFALGVLYNDHALAASPVATAFSTSTNEDTALTVDLTPYASDADGNALTFYKYLEYKGTVTITTAGIATFTPTANYNGTAAYFSFYVKDSTGASSAKVKVSITVNAVNDAPVAAAVSASPSEDVAKSISLSATDVDSTTLTYAIVSSPTHGTLGSVSGSTVSYTSAANYNGTDSFTYKVTDDKGAVSNTATVSLTVAAVNDAPVANALSQTTNEDTPVTFTLTGSDVDGDTLIYSIYAAPTSTKGSAVIALGNQATFTPYANYNGSATFTVRAYDGTTYSSAATITMTITAVNDAPTASAVSTSPSEDVKKTVTLLGSDPDGDALTYAIVANPTHGTVTTPSGATTYYTGSTNYNGTDSFTYKVTDASGNSSAPATVSVSVTAVNDTPTLSALAKTTDEDIAITFTIAGADVDGDALTYSIYTAPSASRGTASITGDQVTFTPYSNYNGSTTFKVRAHDGTAYSSTATITMTITAVNDAPVAAAASATLNEDASGSVTLSATDAESNSLTYQLVDSPTHGTATLSSKTVTYTPVANYNGTDSFTFKAYETATTSSVSNTATVSLTVSPVNDAPTATAVTASTNENTAVTVTLNAADVDGDTLTYTFGTPSGGAVSRTAGVTTYTPTHGYFGTDTFTYKVSDGTLTATANVTVTVIHVNTAPVATNTSATLSEDSPKTFTLTATDADGDALTYAIASNPSHGTVFISSNQATYTPTANYNGTDSFTFTAADKELTSTAMTATLTITAVNDAPSSADVTLATTEDVAVLLELPTTDVDGDTLSYTLGTPAHGSFSFSFYVAGEMYYYPEPDYAGTDEFTYTASDGTTSVTGTVHVTLAAANDAPVAIGTYARTEQDTAVTLTLDSSDIDGADEAVTYLITSDPSFGAVTLSGAQATYTPNAGKFGSDSFTFSATDAGGLSDTATMSVIVGDANDEPVVADITTSTPENTAVDVTLLGTDADSADSDDLSYSVITSANGKATISGSTLTFTPATGFDDTATIEYQATDSGKSVSNTGMITIEITGGVNDAPVATDTSDTANEDNDTIVMLTATDSDSDTLTYAVATNPSHGAVTIVDDQATYIPNADYYGSDSFTFTASDGSKTSNVATVTLTINAMAELTEDCDTTIDATHVMTETDATSGTDIQFFDNQISIGMTRRATAAELEEMKTTAGATSVSCLIEQAPLTDDEAAGIVDASDREYGLYTLEVPAQGSFADLDAKAALLRSLSYVYSAAPEILNDTSPSEAETDAELEGYFTTKAIEQSFFGNIMLPGMYEYLSAYEHQEATLGNVDLAIADTGVCTTESSEWECATKMAGITSEFGSNIKAGPNRIGVLSATKADGSPQPAYPLGLVDLYPSYHGTAVANLMVAASNEMAPSMGSSYNNGGDVPSYANPGNGIVGGVPQFHYTLTSHFTLSDHASYSWSGYYPHPMFYILKDMCGKDVSNNSWSYAYAPKSFWGHVSTSMTIASAASRLEQFMFAREVGACPTTLYAFSAGNDAQDFDTETDYSSNNLNKITSLAGSTFDNAIIVQATGYLTTEPSGASNRGSNITIAAPGYWTSYAAPIVSATAAVLKAVDPSSSTSQIKAFLTQGGLPNSDGVPFLDASASILLAIKGKKADFVPASAEFISYKLDSKLADLRSSEGYTGGTHKETGQWFFDDKTLTIVRTATESADSGVPGPNTGDTDSYYDWQMESKLSSTENYEVGLTQIDDENYASRQIPVEVVMPKGKNRDTLHGKFHAYHYGDDTVPNLMVEDHAQSYCLELNYDVNQSAAASDGKGFHIPLARDSQSLKHAVPFNISGATLKGNVVKKVYDYWNPETTYGDSEFVNGPKDDSTDSGDETDYASMTAPSCVGDITAGIDDNSAAFETWASDLLWREYNTGEEAMGLWQCTSEYGHFESSGEWECHCPSELFMGIWCWDDLVCTDTRETHWVVDGVTEPYLNGYSCTSGEAWTGASDTSCECVGAKPMTGFCLGINDLTETSPWAPENVEVDTHFDVTFGDVNCAPTMHAANLDLFPDNDTVTTDASSDYLQTFSYASLTDEASAKCTTTATVTVTTAFQRKYESSDRDACNTGSMTRILKTTDNFDVDVTWNFDRGVFPVKDFFTKFEEKLATLTDDYSDWLKDGDAYGNGDSYSSQFPFEYLGTGETHYLPELLLFGRMYTPGFGTGTLDPMNWAHGIGPVKHKLEATAEQPGQDFKVTKIQKLDRSVP